MASNTIGPNGLTTKTRQDYVDQIVAGLQAIFGADINVDPNSPDGQLVQIPAQVAIDLTELAVQVYNSMDPDQAFGPTLDQRVTTNGIQRKEGTYSMQFVTVTVTQAVTLPGLNSTSGLSPFTVSDSTGNQFQLINETGFGGAGSADLYFQATQIGAVVVGPNTLTTIATPTVGVASVTNGTLDGVVGANEETDYSLRIRRQNSVALPSTGYFEGLYGGLLALEGVTGATVIENDTTGTVDSVPAHSIWAIVAGGDNDAIADVIYRKRSAGCGMYGAVTVTITRSNGAPFDIKFSRPTAENLWMHMTLTAVTGSVDPTYIREKLVEQLSYQIGQPADASAIVALVKQIAPNVSVSGEGVSNTDGSYVSLKDTTGVNYQWAVDGARIYINGIHG